MIARAITLFVEQRTTTHARQDGLRAVHYAAQVDDVDAFEALVGLGADIATPSPDFWSSQTPLQLALVSAKERGQQPSRVARFIVRLAVERGVTDGPPLVGLNHFDAVCRRDCLFGQSSPLSDLAQKANKTFQTY